MSKLQELRKKYPQYDDLTDEQLAQAFHKKYYSDVPYNEYAAKIGLVGDRFAQMDRGMQQQERVAKLQGQQLPATPQATPEQPGLFSKSLDVAGRFASGALFKPALGATQFLNNTLAGLPGVGGLFQGMADTSNYNVNRLSELEQQSQKQAGNEGFNVAGLAGQVLAPTTALLPAAKAATAFGKVGAGALTGASAAAINPVEMLPNDVYAFNKMKDIIAGAAFGGGIPAGVELVKGGRKFVQDVARQATEEGKNKLLQEWIKDLLPKDKEKLLQVLSSTDAAVPRGPRLTVAQATADMPEATRLAATQAALAKRPEGGISEMFNRIRADQEASRANYLTKEVAGTPEELAARIADRGDTPGYLNAYAQKLKIKPQQIEALTQNPYITEAMKMADKAAAVRTSKGGVMGATEYFHLVKKTLNDKATSANPQTAVGKSEMASIKDSIGQVSDILNSNKEFVEVQKRFREKSIPIDQMKVGQYLLDKLQSPTEKERVEMFARAVQEAPKTLVKATENKGVATSLDKVLTSKQLAAIKNIESDLIREAKASRNAKATNVAGDSATSDLASLPATLTTTGAIVNRVLALVKKDTTEELNIAAAKLFADKDAFAAFLRGMPKEKGKSKTVVSALYQKLSPENRILLEQALFEPTKKAAIGTTAAQLGDE